MPTHEPARAISRATVAAIVADAVAGRATTGWGIGLELEMFPVTQAAPTRRLQLHDAVAGVPPTTDLLTAATPEVVVGGSSVTVEPGGQVEVATECYQRVADALAELERSTGRLAACFDAHGAALVAAGVDVWHDVASVPQQLANPRYEAMDAYLAGRSSEGRVMMRHTCALQVNLDLGRGHERDDRWQVANLLAPIATASFATSPARVGGRLVRSRRAVAWQSLDPSRTGFPRAILAGRGHVETDVLELALDADVLLVRTPDGGAVPGRPGWSFGAWVDHGHPQLGWPTEQDVREHLTTLFPEVRARGFVELRSVDAVPAAFRTAVVVLLVGALLHAPTRAAIRGLLEPHQATLPALLRRCATVGLSDPRLCALAVEVWAYARDGAGSLPGVSRSHLAAVEAFIDRFTVRGRCPADELAELIAHDPAAALAWAKEPLPTTAEVL